MAMTRKYGIDLDIGIGYVGFAVALQTGEDSVQVEDAGVRFFASGKIADGRVRKNQERRVYRNLRRVVRRRAHRKDRVKSFLQKIGLLTDAALRLWQEKNGNQNIFSLRLKGLTEKLTAEEITDCIIHICNHRGYSDYYNEEISSKDAGLVKAGLAEFERIFSNSNYRSVADMVLNDEAFKTATSFPDYHNHKNNDRYVLIKRAYIRKELLDILHVQAEYYPQLTEGNINFLCDKIVFAQRDFETGPGTENDKLRKFMGYLDSVGKCRFYKEEKRGFKSTVLADVFILINRLSRYKFVDMEGGTIRLPRDVARVILKESLLNAKVSEKWLGAILKRFGISIVSGNEKVKLNDTLKTLKILKSALDTSGYNYQELISEERFVLECPSKLQKLSLLLSENVTPKRRNKVLKEAGWNEQLCQKLLYSNFGGTVNVGERYMTEAINAFMEGENYCTFKARLLRERRLAYNKVKSQAEHKHKTLPALTKNVDEEIMHDVVMFKTINETRKVINAIIGRYGSPRYINIAAGNFINRYIANYLETNLLFDEACERNVRVAKSNIATKIYKTWSNGEMCEGYDRQPLISYKQNKKFQGKLTDDNPVPKSKCKDSSIVKLDARGNENVLSANKYYCVEIYKDNDNRTVLRGIRYVDLKKQDKKLYLNIPYPKNYREHMMYLFTNDYLRIFDDNGNLKLEGWYRSVRAITRSLLNVRSITGDKDIAYYVTRKDVFKKYYVDVLGKLGGEVKSFKPLTLLEEK
ncbi:MAG: hypothetical protein IJ376_00375 [Acidaminococcaceae bacterium]|nr:hypothetical protein [Acidaminococcaceae bacterium]